MWEKPVRERREEMCIYLCWWGMISALICLQSSLRIALQAAEAMRSLYQPRRPRDEVREHLMEVHICTHTQTLAVEGGVKINLHAAAKFVDLNYTMSDRQIIPKANVQTALFIQIKYQLSAAITGLNTERQDRFCSALMKCEGKFMGEICHVGYDIIGFGLLQLSIFSLCPNLNY